MTNTAATATHTLVVIDHSDNTGNEEEYATLTEAATSLDHFAEEGDLIVAEGHDGMYVLLDAAGHHTHTAYIAA